MEKALNQDTRDVVNPSHLMLEFRNSNLPNPGAQTQDSCESSLGKENALFEAVFSDDTEDGVLLKLYIRLERGPHGKWRISWSNVTGVDPSVNQASDLKPIDFIKPKLNSAPSVGHNPNPKPSGHEVDPSIDQASNPKPIDFIKPKPNSAPSVSQNPNPKPSGHYKPKHKPAFKWKPKKSQPFLTQSQTHPRSKFS